MLARRWSIAALSVLSALTATHVEAQGRTRRTITPFATGGVVEHRVNVTGDVERVAGAVWGAGVRVGMSDWLGLQGRIASGNLGARTPDAESRALSEAELIVILTPDRWISVDAGTTVRTMETPLVRQRWVEMRAGSEIGVDLIDGVLRGNVRLSISPWVSVSGQPSPDLAIGAGSGLQYTSRRLIADLTYSLDRYDFPAGAEARRLEQRSALTARIGWRVR